MPAVHEAPAAARLRSAMAAHPELVAGTGLVPYAIGDNPYGIRGGGFLARSAQGNTITVGTDPGKICISGSLEEVPLNPDGHGNYGQYWGVELGFNLNQAPADGSDIAAPPPAADAAAGSGAAARRRRRCRGRRRGWT